MAVPESTLDYMLCMVALLPGVGTPGNNASMYECASKTKHKKKTPVTPSLHLLSFFNCT